VLTVTQPAPTTGAVRPQIRNTYTQIPAGTGPYMLTAVSACQTLTSCANAADETRAVIAYNTALHPSMLTRRDGTGTLSAATAMTYDNRGNLLTVDGPLAGADDTTRYRYDTADQLIGVVGPNPDGAGPLKHRAIRTTYRPDGQVSKQERGTVTSQTDPAWAAFAPLETVDITFNSNNRPITSKLSGGGTAFALTQTSYDAVGRPECSAVRMNTAIYGSLPASACTLGTQGSFGPDRISKTIYDAAGQVTQRQVAFGTTDVATERTLTYSNNGRLQTLKDAENNLTTYEYDGHDRLQKTRFPLPAKGANASSTTDYEQLTYHAASNVTSRRLRDATSIAFTYDNLNRPTLKNLPAAEPDVTYAYDNFGRLTSASQTGNSLSFTYDALSRNLTQVGPQGTGTSEWDLAGRRTKLTYPGSGLYVDYDYLVTGDMTKIRENGATSGIGVLATFGYDDLGRRISLTYGNGAATTYAYDAVSRLATLTNDLTGTADDLTIGPMSYSPASQIMSQARSNDAFAWTGHGLGSTAGVANGLNQLTSIGGSATTHDTKGNLTTDPTTGKTYGYSSENLLTSASGGATLGYDSGMRLHQVAGASTVRFAYDGFDMIAEYDGSDALQRRYVHGPAMDEPLVQYEGSDTTDRRFLHADERGSVVAISDGSGNLLTINRYDEFGKPQATNAGRFQYTGQMWIGELGLYHYKARAYAPHLGRFLQIDPIGYEGGVNLYAYVGNDSINFTDPNGLGRVYWASHIHLKKADGSGVNWGGIGQTDVEKYGTNEPSQGGGSGGSLICIKWCNNPPSGQLSGGEIVNYPPPVLIQIPGPRWDMLPGTVLSPTRSGDRSGPSPPAAFNRKKNYCGGEGGASLPNAVGGVSINDLCYAHDVCYAASGTPKSACDINFGANIIVRLEVFSKLPEPTIRTLIAVVAGSFGYGLVWIGGKPYYVPK